MKKRKIIGYYALHRWVRKQLGTPSTCENCGKTGLKGRQIHWANIDEKYERNLKSWMRLCASCHQLYDRQHRLYLEQLEYENSFPVENVPQAQAAPR
jgi:uncharacterized protein with PIN domain